MASSQVQMVCEEVTSLVILVYVDYSYMLIFSNRVHIPVRL